MPSDQARGRSLTKYCSELGIAICMRWPDPAHESDIKGPWPELWPTIGGLKPVSFEIRISRLGDGHRAIVPSKVL
jgi:hypothetical protein